MRPLLLLLLWTLGALPGQTRTDLLLPEWYCAANGAERPEFRAGSTFYGFILAPSPRLRVNGDFRVGGRIAAANRETAVFLSLHGALSTSNTEFWRGSKRLDFGVSGNQVWTSVWTGESANNTFRAFAFPGGRPEGLVTLEAVRQGAEIVIFANEREAGRFADPGLFTAGDVWLGVNVAPENTLTLDALWAEGGATLVDPAAQAVSRTGNGLRDLASARGLFYGAEVDPRLFTIPEYAQTTAREHNMLVPGNAMKFDATQPAPGRYNFCAADVVVRFAAANHMAVRGHVLVWHEQVPQWVRNGTFSREEARAILKEHIERVVGRYRGRIVAWDVVNEAIADTGANGLRESPWLRLIGPDYIDDAFRWAHAADPQARLFYNDYSAEGLGAKSDAVLRLVEGMRQRGVPVHGVGLQMHVLANGQPSRADISANIRRLGQLGLEVQITEMDVRLRASDTLAAQAQVYRNVVAACRENANCTAILNWGVTDAHSWVDSFFPGFSNALLFDRNYQPKPAYAAVAEELARGARVTQIYDGGVVIHGGTRPVVAPGALVDVYGERFGAANAVVTVNGSVAPVVYTTPGQVAFQMPYETLPGYVQVRVRQGTETSLPVTLEVKRAAPSLLTWGNNRAIVQNEDYSLNAAGNCARPGSYLVGYLMGAGPSSVAVATGAPSPGQPLAAQVLPVRVEVGGVAAPVVFAGLTPGFLGLMQVNFQAPAGVAGDVEMTVGIGGEVSNRARVCLAP
jgi:endo-1,4-beta-xylanase